MSRRPARRTLRMLLRLAAAERRDRPGRARAAVAVVTIGAALLTAALVLTDTMQRSVDRGLSLEYDGVDVVVRTDLANTSSDAGGQGASTDGIPAETLATIESLPDVARLGTYVRANGVIQVGDVARGIALETVPTVPDFAWQRWSEGRPPSAPGEIALTQHTLDALEVGVGDRIALGSPGVGRAQLEVVGTVDVRGSLTRERSAYGIVMPEVAQRLAGVSQPNVVLVDTRPGADLDAVIGQINEQAGVGWPQLTRDLIHGAADAHGFRISALGAIAAGLAGVTLAIVAVALAASSAAAARSRRRLFALVRCVGASRGHVVALTVVEVLLPAALGAIVGVAVGLVVARLLIPAAGLVPGLYPIRGDAFTVQPSSLLLPFVVVLALALLAGLVPAWLAARVSPAGAVGAAGAAGSARTHSAAAGRRRAVVSAALVVIGVLLAGAGAGGTPLLLGLGTVLLLAGAVAGTAPLLARVAETVRRRVRRPALRLALADIRDQPGTAATEGIAVLVAVAVLALTWTATAGIGASAAERLSDSRLPDLTIGAPAGAPVIADETVDALRDVDGVAAVVPLDYGVGVSVVGRGESGRASLSVGTVAADAKRLGAALPEGLGIDLLRDDTVYLPEVAFPPFPADARVRLTGPEGTVRDLAVRYVADLPVPSAVSPATLERVTATTERREAWVRAEAGVDRARLVDEVAGLAVLGGELPVQGPLVADVRTAQAIATVRTAAVAVLAIGALVAIVGAATTASISVGERYREFALMRALGLERERLASMLALRLAVVGAVAVAVGVALGSLVGLLVARAVANGLDLDPLLRLPLLPVLAMSVLTVLLVRAAAGAALERYSFVPPSRALARS